MQCTVMASALNSKLHWKIFMWLHKVIVDVVVIYYYVKKWLNLRSKKKKHLSMPKKVKEELKNIAVPSEVMKQIGVDICCLPSVDEFEYLIVCIDYFSKWSEAKPIHDKSAPTVAQFLYEPICRHGCFAIQINDQGREFVNEVADELHSMTGTQQIVTSAYHPPRNGSVERENQKIKNALVKFLDQNPKQWPDVIDSVLFVH